MLSSAFPIFCINVFVTFAVVTLKAYLNFTQIRFESFFRGKTEKKTGRKHKDDLIIFFDWKIQTGPKT